MIIIYHIVGILSRKALAKLNLPSNKKRAVLIGTALVVSV